MTAVAIIFWLAAAAIVYTHVGYTLVLWLLSRVRPMREPQQTSAGRTFDAARESELPMVSLIIAAHDEAKVIAAKIDDAQALDFPRERLQVIVASDGSTDDTIAIARAAGADLVLDLPRMGKLLAQNAGAARASGEVLAFSDANAFWRPDALLELIAPLAAADVGYVCGQAAFTAQDGSNQEGVYWRYELTVRQLESDLAGVTAGNGAIYAVKREAYIPLGQSASHDLSFPFMLRKRGWRSVYAPKAIATEKMVATTEGEYARKRRMMRGVFDEVIADGMLNPTGYGALYGFEIFSHRALRYATPLLHAVAFVANVFLLGEGPIYIVTFVAQLALLAAAAVAEVAPSRLTRLARYYVLVTASIATGAWDRMRHGTPGAWDQAEGTR
jgi:cellulose synthase/poly-beta-1,6-N-acetylglucosamine synthase-like glycosyltransferase